MVEIFKIRRSWIPTRAPLRRGLENELDATMCRLEITLGGRNVTAYQLEHGEREDRIELPAYYLAEWIAENWWALLNEPRKSEDTGDDPEFLSRHSFITAQHGFVLPAILVVPVGKSVQISATSRQVPYADARFRYNATALLPRPDVAAELKRFTQGVVDRLGECRIDNLPLQEAWELVASTTDQEEVEFCELVGALGLNPYDTHEVIEQRLEHLLPILGMQQLRDLCLGATESNFMVAARAAERLHEELRVGPTIRLEPLSKVSLPPENLQFPAWRRGVEAARRVRNRFSVSEMDPSGSSAVFEQLGVDPSRALDTDDDLHYFAAHPAPLSNRELPPPLVGAVAREEQMAHMALLQDTEMHRRFAAGRATYLAWSSENGNSRFMTNALTRDQQASRAFAAELLAPFAYIKSQAHSGRIAQHRVYEIAHALGVGTDVVRKHAENNGLQITAM